MSKVTSIFTRRPELTPAERAAAIQRAEVELQEAFAKFRARTEQHRRTANQLSWYGRHDHDKPPPKAA